MKKILFVCLGNICRSPAAEGIMKKMLEDAELTEKIICDSAGTSAFHVGELPDTKMKKYAAKRGYNLTSHSRQFEPTSDFENFNYIITMDISNYENVLETCKNKDWKKKLVPFVDFCTKHNVDQVDDPYGGWGSGFEKALDVIEDGCKGLLKKLTEEL